jgi:two-component system, LytTR family, response regulator
MKINCIAIDDEPPALAQIEDYISRVPFLNLLKKFDNALSCIEFMKTHQIDLMFLDVEMEGLSGIQLLKIFQKRKPRVILTTAYESYALKAFELDVNDYLLKPISFERFLTSVEKIYDIISLEKNNLQQNSVKSSDKDKDYIFVKTEYKMQRVNFKDILYIEGLKEYLIIKTKTSKIITLQTFKNFEQVLPATYFLRVHKSFIVALDKIETIDKQNIIISGKEIPIGEKYKNVFYKTINTFKI